MSRILRLAAVASLFGVAVYNSAHAASTPAAAQPAASAESASKAAAKPHEAKPAMAKPASAVAAKPAASAVQHGGAAVLTKEQALTLASKGNCLVCHKIDSKLVGPAWKDVGAKYKNDTKAAATIAASIKAGGSFGWKLGTMPPRGGSKISDADVESLAKFIASLK